MRGDTAAAVEIDTEMSAALLHEVKNPLALVRANIDLLELDDAEDAHRKRFDAIRRELDRANEILTEFAAFASAPQGETRECDLYEIILEQVMRYAPAYSVGDVFRFASDTDYALFTGDPARVSMVVSNILKNALEACGANPLITIDIYSDERGVYAEFRDNGRGLRAARPDKRFSNGIGLSICRKIMAGHGGGFEIADAEGGGCVVRIFFPQA